MNAISPHKAALKHNLASCVIYTNEDLPLPTSDHLRIFLAKKTTAYTAAYKNAALHSAYDPVREAKNISQSLSTGSFDSIILIGAGLGYTVVELAKRYQNIPVLCVEYNVPLFASLLHQWQYPSLGAHAKYVFFVQALPTDITEYLREKGLRNPCIFHTHIAKNFFPPQKSEALVAEVTNYKIRVQVNDNTLQQFSRLWQKNIIRNCTWYAKHITSLSPLKNTCSGVPALLCCAGPSLYQHLPHIQKLKPHMLLVAVDTALGVLAEHNIVPDFICSVDPQYINTQHLQWHAPHAPHYLIDCAVSPRIFQLAQKQSVFFASKPIIPLAQSLYRNMDFDAEIHSGGSVATFAWDALRYMGITDIYTVGLDLSYPLHAAHSRGCTFENASHTTSIRTAPAETTLHRMLCAAPLVATRSYKNTAVLSDKRLMVYHQWFHTMHEKFPHVKTYTFCKNAARIPAVEHRNAEEVVESLRNTATHAQDAIRAMLTKQLNAKTNPHIIQKNAQQLQKELMAFAALCRSAAHITHKALHSHISRTELAKLQRIEHDIHSNNLSQCLASSVSETVSESPSVSQVIEFFVQKDIQSILTHERACASPSSGENPSIYRDEKAYTLYKAMYHCALSLETFLRESLDTHA